MLLKKRTLGESWKSADVAQQQQNLIKRELSDPLNVPPFRSFIEIMRYVDAGCDTAVRNFLDIGCGVGHYAELLSRYFPGRFQYTGTDYSENMISRARDIWKHSSFVVDDILHSRIDFRRFDILFASALVDVIHDFRTILQTLFSGTSHILILHRQRLTDAASRSEVTAGYDGQKTFATYLNRNDLVESLRRNGLTLLKEYIVLGNIHSFLIERAE